MFDISGGQKTLFFKKCPNNGLVSEKKYCLEKAVGAHFNGPGHKVSDMSVTILEKVWNTDPMYLSVREEFWINKLNCKNRGMNRKKGG